MGAARGMSVDRLTLFPALKGRGNVRSAETVVTKLARPP